MVIYVDVVQGSSGLDLVVSNGGKISVVSGQEALEILRDDKQKICFNLRRVMKLCGRDVGPIYDLDLLYDGRGHVGSTARENLREAEICDYLSSVARSLAHVRAASAAKVDPAAWPEWRLVPPDVRHEHWSKRADVVWALWNRLDQNDLVGYEVKRDAALALYEAERSGVALDTRVLSSVGDRTYVSKLLSMESDGLTRTAFNVVGGKTGRISTRPGFPNFMNMPHGQIRRSIVSRWPGGKIASFDFNAIDYRCIVGAIPELRALYEGCDDFHLRTAEIVFGRAIDDHDQIRKLVKAATYVVFYGGNATTLAKSVDLSIVNATRMIEMLKTKLPHVESYKRYVRSCVRNGELKTGYKTIVVEDGTHDGALLARLAQAASAFFFKIAIGRVGKDLAWMRSKIIMTIHDELVLDMHPSELDFVDKIRSSMEEASSTPTHFFKVKISIGDNFAELRAHG